MQEIKTLVYFDLEATGLKSSGRPRVCEISLVAVNVSDVLNLRDTIMDHLNRRRREDSSSQLESISPRVINKLSLCVYPMATIVPDVTDITGLDNYNLTGQTKFDKDIAKMLNIFLSRLPSPVCLVAHNGNLYDFPLLKAEIEKAGTELDSQILCADSYIGIKEIFKKREHINEKGIVEDKKMEESDVRNHVKIEVDAVADRMKIEEFENKGNIKYQENISSSNNCKSFKVSKQENETTPGKSCTERTLTMQRKSKQLSYPRELPPRKMLNFSSMPASFSLINLHKYLLGCAPTQSHGAEADCMALMRVTAVLGKDWLGWVQENCSRFNDCKKMWSIHSK
jgi:three prime repair exonuclease-1